MADESDWRPPTDFEAAVIATLVQARYEGREIVAAQIGEARVMDDCGCGCMSLRFEVPGAAPRLPEGWLWQEFAAEDGIGGKHSLSLIADAEGRISFLDHVFWDFDNPGLFAVESIRVCDTEPSGPTAWAITPRAMTVFEESATGEDSAGT